MTFIGFDPGGACGSGCAVVRGELSACATVDSVDGAMRWAVKACGGSTPAAAGIDTLLFWQTTPSGWRGADEYLRRRYPGSKSSVLCSNALYGSMSVQGATLALRLRELWPGIVLTETHPKVLWAHLDTGFEYPREPRTTVGAVGWLERATGTALEVEKPKRTASPTGRSRARPRSKMVDVEPNDRKRADEALRGGGSSFTGRSRNPLPHCFWNVLVGAGRPS